MPLDPDPPVPPFPRLRQIGQGAAGEVWEVLDPSQQRRCALKVVTPSGTTPSAAIEQLAAEVQTVQAIRHPNVMEVWKSGSGWWIGPLYPGGSVSERISRGPLSGLESAAVLDGLLAGLEAVHRSGKVHRDVGPANLVWDSDGGVRLIDFGVATGIGEVVEPMGSPAYMSPEQRVRGPATVAMDVYGAGATLFACLTGGTPLDLHHTPPTSPRFAGLPADVVDLIRRATSVESAMRFEDTNAFRTALWSLEWGFEQGAGDSRTPTAEVRRETAQAAPTRLTEQQLEDRRMRRWLEEEAEQRHRTTRRNARLFVAALLAVVLVGVAIGAQVSLERWVERERLAVSEARAPRTGEWVGVVGHDVGRLVIHTAPDRLTMSFTREGEMVDRYDGTRDGVSIVSTGARGSRFELVQSGIHLDGRWVDAEVEEQVHLVWRRP